MAQSPKKKAAEPSAKTILENLSERAKPVSFQVWIIGDTPLISHAWSEKAKQAMLSKQVKATRDAKAARDPDQDFVDSLYKMPDGKTYGFPVMAFKKAILGGAHKDKGIAKTDVLASLWVDGDMVRIPTVHPGAICDMPLVRLIGTPPVMREDMVRVGTGMTKTATLAYRAQFTRWAIILKGRFNPKIIPPETLAFLTNEAGFASGVGDWRNEKGGMFGAFHLASAAEQAAWEAFVAGTGPLPPEADDDDMKMAAD